MYVCSVYVCMCLCSSVYTRCYKQGDIAVAYYATVFVTTAVRCIPCCIQGGIAQFVHGCYAMYMLKQGGIVPCLQCMLQCIHML